MDRETLLLVAIVMLTAAAFTVGVSGWILLARDRRSRLALPSPAAGAARHPKVPEER